MHKNAGALDMFPNPELPYALECHQFRDMDNFMRFLRIPEHKQREDEDLTQRKLPFPENDTIWIPDKSLGFRLCNVIDESSTDFVVGFRDEQGFFEKKRLTKPQCEFVSKNTLADDLCTLTEPNAATVLDALTRRYNLNVIHTYSGLFCVVINPWKKVPIYSEEVMQLYQSTIDKNPPPHVFSVAQAACDGIQHGGTNQSILITGESGAGKTENTKRIIEYVLNVAGAKADGVGTDVVCCGQLLEAFGNAATTANNNSSRFGKFIRIEFDEECKMQAAQIDCYLLEKSRVVSQNCGERNFHIFYQLLSNAFNREIRESLGLKWHSQKYRFLNQGGNLDKHLDDEVNGKLTDNAMIRLGIDDTERMQVYEIVASCILIGEIRFKERTGLDLSYVDGHDEIDSVASLLCVKGSKMADALTQPTIKVGENLIRKNQNLKKTLFSVSALAKALYERLFRWLLDKCNVAIMGGSNASFANSTLRRFIGVLDIAGFEIIQKNSFEQFCINYTNEKLQQFFNHFMFVKEQSEYLQEGIKWEHIDFANDLQPTIGIIEKPLGLLSLLEEECVVPNGSDMSLLEKFSRNLADYPQFKKSKQSQRVQTVNHFAIKHYAGEVDYNIDGWLEKNKDAVEQSVLELMSESTHPLVSKLFPPIVDEMTRSRRGGLATNTVSYVYKNQLSSLLDTLNSSSAHFIRCIVPNHDQVPGNICGPMVLHQLKCNGVLEGIRICRQGFPNRLQFDDFVQRYGILGGDEFSGRGRLGAVELCSTLNLSEERFQIGNTKIFCKVGVVSELEEQRKNYISQLLTGLQTHIRTYLMEKDCDRRERRRDAIYTIQDNVRAFNRVCDWPWFKLLSWVNHLIPREREKEKIKELEEEKEELLQRQEEIEQEREQLAQMIESARVEEERVRRKADEEKRVAEQALQEKARELREMKEDMQNNEEIFDMLEKKYKEQHQKILKMTEILRDYERRFERIEMERAELEKELAKTKEALERERECRQGVQTEYQNSQITVSEMEAKIQKMEDDANKLRLQIAKLESGEGDHVDRAKRQSDLISELQKTISELNERMTKNDSLVNEERNLRRKIERECERVKDENKHTAEQVSKMIDKYDSLKDTVRDRDNTIRKLEKKLADKESLMQECVRDLKESHKSRVTALKDQLDEVKKKNSKLESENTCQKMKLEHSDSTISLNRMDRENSVDSDYYTGRGSIGRMSMSSHSGLGTIGRQYSLSSMGSFSSIRTMVRRRETEPDIHSNMYSSTTLSRVPSSSSVSEHERKIKELERQLQDTKTELNLKNREMDVYKTSLTAVEQEKDSLSRQVRTLANDVERISKELERAEKAQQTAELRIKKHQSETEHWQKRFEEQIKENKQIIEDEKRKLVDRIEESQHEKELRSSRMAALQRSKDDLQSQLSHCQHELDTALATIAIMERNSKQQEYLGDNLEAQYREAMAEVESLRDDNAALKSKIRRQYKQIELLTQQEDSVGAMSFLEQKFDKLNGRVPDLAD